MSQEQLGEALGVSRQAVSKWESGQTKPDLEAVGKMCELFHLSADYLLLGKEDKKDDGSSAQAQAQPQAQSQNQTQYTSGGYSLVLVDTNPTPRETLHMLLNSGMPEEEVDRLIESLPAVLASGLSLEEAYRRAKDFERCGLVKVIRDESAKTQESMLWAVPIEAPEEKGAGLGFGGTVLAVIVGIILSPAALDAFLRANAIPLALIILTAVLYWLSRLALTGLPGAAGRFFAWYFHDILAGAMILSLANLLLSAGRLPPLTKVLPTAAFLLLCGLFWKYVSPLLVSGSVSDPLDLLAYLAGGLVVLPLLRLARQQSR